MASCGTITVRAPDGDGEPPNGEPPSEGDQQLRRALLAGGALAGVGALGAAVVASRNQR